MKNHKQYILWNFLLAGWLLILSACGGRITELPPTADIITFTAGRTNLQAGECTVLEWNVTEGIDVTLDGQPVDKTGQMEVCPAETRGYELNVEMGTQVETRQVEITVSGGTGQPGGSQTQVPPGTPAYQSEAWVQLGGPPGGLGYDIRYDFSDFNRWYVTDAFAGFFFSDDRGLTWTASNQGLQPFGERGDFLFPVFSVTVDQHNPSTVWTGLQFSGHVYKSTDRAQTWVLMENGITPNGQSFRGFTVDPRSSDIVYAASEVAADVFVQEGKKPQGTTGSGGRVYRTTDGGKNWNLIWEGDALARYVWIAPDDPNRIYVSTGIFDRYPLNYPENATPDNSGGVGVLRSTDGGSTWTVLGRQNGLHSLSIGSLYMKPDDSRTLLAGAGSMMGIVYENVNGQEVPFGGVYLTTDGGDHWQEVISNEHIGAVEYCLQNPSIAYAASGRAVFRSTDGGQTWTQRSSNARPTWGPPGLSPGMPIDMQTDPQDCDRVFINNYVGGNFLSEDGGQTWTIASRGYTGADPPRVFVDPSDPAHVWTVTRMAPWESNDGGFTWNPMAFPDLVAGGEIMGMDPADARHVLIDSLSLLFETEDGGKTWTERQKTVCPQDVGEAGCMGMMFSEIVFAPSNTQTIYAGSRNTSVALEELQPAKIRGFGIAKSTDGGKTWTTLADPKIARLAIMAITVSPIDPQTVYAGGSAGFGVFKSTDGGQSWSSVNQGLPEPVGIIYVLTVDPSNPSRLLLGSSQGLFVSTDAAASWTQVAAGVDANAMVRAVIFDKANPKIVYAATNAGIVYSTDGGQSFQPLNQGLGGKILVATHLALSADESVLYAASVGIFRLGTPDQP